MLQVKVNSHTLMYSRVVFFIKTNIKLNVEIHQNDDYVLCNADEDPLTPKISYSKVLPRK